MSANNSAKLNSNSRLQKFLVTGATGFVGGYLLGELLKSHGPESVSALVYTSERKSERQKLNWLRAQGVTLLECDLLQLPDLNLKVPPFDVVYHFAGATESENPRGNFLANSEGTRKLLEWLGPQLQGKRFIYTGTVAGIDADDSTGPVTEATVCAPKTPYGRTKMEGEAFVQSCSRQWQFQYTIVRLCTIVGQGYRPGGMFGILPKLLERQALSTRLNWPGRGSYLDVRDLIQILLALPGHAETANELFLLGNGEAPSFDELMETVARVHQLPRRRIVVPGWLWRILHALAWQVVRSQIAPHRLHIACWRAAHIIGNGFWADNTKITRLLGMKYRSVAEAVRNAYEK